MSLTYNEIESLLAEGVGFHAYEKEFLARLDSVTDVVTIIEMSGLGKRTLPIELVVDEAHAHNSGSDLADVAALRALLAKRCSRPELTPPHRERSK
jgi:hypothetical protein